MKQYVACNLASGDRFVWPRIGAGAEALPSSSEACVGLPQTPAEAIEFRYLESTGERTTQTGLWTYAVEHVDEDAVCSM